jgi:GH25 family lysozyme M1 (1,4-beta-N-acetylmuramidase)
LAARYECLFTGPKLAHGISGDADVEVFRNSINRNHKKNLGSPQQNTNM